MKTSHSARLQSLFASALEFDEPERTQFIERECGDDASLQRELRELLATDAKVAGLTAPPLSAALSDALAALTPGSPLTGTRVGAFELGEELGRGGMGRVYRARRVDGVVEQDVAIKFVRRELLDANTIRRFQLERQLMATLDHPHIARLIDAAELADGTPYYVMEYVAGEPITEHCEHAKLDLRARVELLRKVCEAVAEAHRRLIVHRDLKPGNILVTANGTPKLLDFGISKPLDAPGSVEATGTAERYFSPQYAAPEQVAGEPVGVACDVYALGVLFYELLTRRKPFDFTGLSAGQVERLITQVPPIAPSESLEKAGGADARARARQLRGDLDGIVLRCMKKAPNERYASVEQLVADLGNYLDGRPVQARGGHRWYRAQKFVRRNLLPVSAISLAVLALIGGAVAFAWQAREAQQRAAELEQVAAFQSEMLTQVDPTKAGLLLTEDIRERHAAALESASIETEVRARLAGSLQAEWRRLNATDVATNLIDRTILQPAVAAIDARFATQPVVAAKLQQALADRYAQFGIYEVAAGLQHRALATRKRVLGAEHPETLGSVDSLATLLDLQSKYEEALVLLQENVQIRTRVQGAQHRDTLKSRSHVAATMQALGKLEEAEPLLRETLDAQRRNFGETDDSTLASMGNLSALLMDRGELEEGALVANESLAGYRRVRGPDHFEALIALNTYAMILWRANRLAEAEPLVRESLERRRRVLGEDHPMTLTGLNNLALLLQALGRLSEAEPVFREALEKRRSILGDDHQLTISAMSNVGGILMAQERPAEAEPFQRTAFERSRVMMGDDHPETIRTRRNFGMSLLRQGKLDEADAHLREALAARVRALGPDHPDTLSLRDDLGTLRVEQRQYAAAEELLSPMEPALRKAYAGARECNLSVYLLHLGAAEAGLGHADAARRRLSEAKELADRGCPPTSGHHARVANAIASVSSASGG